MATAATEKKKRSGSRAPTNPRTKAQRLTRVAELTNRMDTRSDEIAEMGGERNKVMTDLRVIDGATLKEIATAAGKSEQAISKAMLKPKKAAAKKAAKK